jgi:hypothetical protein
MGTNGTVRISEMERNNNGIERICQRDDNFNNLKSLLDIRAIR